MGRNERTMRTGGLTLTTTESEPFNGMDLDCGLQRRIAFTPRVPILRGSCSASETAMGGAVEGPCSIHHGAGDNFEAATGRCSYHSLSTSRRQSGPRTRLTGRGFASRKAEVLIGRIEPASVSLVSEISMNSSWEDHRVGERDPVYETSHCREVEWYP